METKKTILEFKIGKWDAKNRYYQNGGGLKFRDESSGIGSCYEMEQLFPPCFKNGKERKTGEYKDDQGNGVGLTVEMVKSGIGEINLDREFDTVYTKFLDEKLTEKEIQAIFDSNPTDWIFVELLKYFTQSELQFMGWEFEETDVFFHMEPEGNQSFDCFAYFPNERYDYTDKDKFTGYRHVGQHTAMHKDYPNERRQATPEEYKDLKSELIRIGYKLNVLNKK